MKRIFLITCVVSQLVGAGTVLGSAKLDGSQLREVTLTYQTPYLDWGFQGAKAVADRDGRSRLA